MLDKKEIEIEYLQARVEYLKSKLKQAIEGNITTDPVVNKIIQKIIKRHKQGMVKFGKTMEDNNRPLNEWVKEAQEESLDFIHYLEKLLK
jgi:transcriptional regulator NrdR family protein